MDSVGTRVRSEREAQGIDRKELARRTGVGYSTLAELENGRMQTTTKLRLIAEALGVSLAWLETGSGPKHDRPRAASPQSVGLDLPTLHSAIRLLELVAEIRGTPAPGVSAEAIAIAYEIVQSAGDGMDESNVVDFMRALAARLDDTKGGMDGAKRGPTARTG